ncbi:MAG: RDD family protein [Acidobacteria bacterium]|nr:RDD family protein [Acidobacteriota bacterium]
MQAATRNPATSGIARGRMDCWIWRARSSSRETATYIKYDKAREGQTIGKRVMHIRIVNYDDGQTAGPGRTIWKRTILNGLLGNFIPLYGLIDPLFIFGAERRCLHDYIAGTKVVEAP